MTKIISGSWKPFKNDEKCFLSQVKALFVLKLFSDHVGKRFDKKARFSFKIHDVTDWQINNYKTYIAHLSQEVKAFTQWILVKK